MSSLASWVGRSVLILSPLIFAATAPQSGTNAQFGAQFGGFGEYFDGSISNVAIYAGPPATVPEPAGLAVLALAGLALARLRRRAPAV